MKHFGRNKRHPTFCINMDKRVKTFIVKLFDEFGKLFGIFVRENQYCNLIVGHISGRSTIVRQVVR